MTPKEIYGLWGHFIKEKSIKSKVQPPKSVCTLLLEKTSFLFITELLCNIFFTFLTMIVILEQREKNKQFSVSLNEGR